MGGIYFANLFAANEEVSEARDEHSYLPDISAHPVHPEHFLRSSSVFHLRK